MAKFALVNNLIVTEIVEFDVEQYSNYAKTNDMVIDVTDIEPSPQVGWVLEGNALQFPSSETSVEKLEIALNAKKRQFGTNLSNIAIDRIGARNKILKKNGTQVTNLLIQLMSVKSLLETGALGTARYACIQLKVVYTEYEDIFNYVINEINVFESSSGL